MYLTMWPNFRQVLWRIRAKLLTIDNYDVSIHHLFTELVKNMSFLFDI